MQGKDNFTIIPNEIMEKIKNPLDKLVFYALCKFMYGKKDVCHPSVESLSKVSGISMRATSRSINNLCDLGVINKKRTRYSCFYSILPQIGHTGISGHPQIGHTGISEKIQICHTGMSDMPHRHICLYKENKEENKLKKIYIKEKISTALKTKKKRKKKMNPDLSKKIRSGEIALHEVPRYLPNSNFEEPKKIKELYSKDFEEAWDCRPVRSNDSKVAAWRQWGIRIKDGYSVEDMKDGVRRYKKYCDEYGKIGTEFVMMMSTFFGKDCHFMDTYASKPAVSGNKPKAKLFVAERVSSSERLNNRRSGCIHIEKIMKKLKSKIS